MPSWTAVLKACEKGLTAVLLLLIGAYRTMGTTHLGGACRFQPSCSEYALEAIRVHHPLRALGLILSRVWRCRPGGSFGPDPVPTRKGCSTC